MPTTRNYYPVVDTEFTSHQTPHTLYRSLAVDAALRHLDSALPSLGDEEMKRVTEAAEIAALALLKLLNVADTWPDFLDRAAPASTLVLRDQLADTVFNKLPPGRPVDDILDRAWADVKACAGPGKSHRLREAAYDLELAYTSRNSDDIMHAFALGYQIARNPERLIFEDPNA